MNKWMAGARAFMGLLDQSPPEYTQSFDSLNVRYYKKNPQRLSLQGEKRLQINGGVSEDRAAEGGAGKSLDDAFSLKLETPSSTESGFSRTEGECGFMRGSMWLGLRFTVHQQADNKRSEFWENVIKG